MTIRQWIEAATARLRGAGDPDARWDADWMLSDAMHTGRSQLRLRASGEIPPEALLTAEGWLKKRLDGVPLQYAQGCAYFMGRRFLVDERVLIPRQDTEILVEAALKAVARGGRCLDLCCGSGAIGITLKLERPDLSVALSDISEGAAALAEENARRLGARAEVLRGDLFAPVKNRAFDLIACNPPYLSEADLKNLDPLVAREPVLSLDGGRDGLNFYRRIAAEYESRLRPGGQLLLELGAGQAQAVLALFAGAETEIIPDLNGVQRALRVVCGKQNA